MRKLFIHVGMPKSGSTAIQRFTRDNASYLLEHSIDFLPRRRKGSYNDLAIALRNDFKDEVSQITNQIIDLAEKSPAKTLALSSEMFSGVDPVKMRQALSFDHGFDVTVIGYFRRQDKYFAKSYAQKLKSAKTKVGMEHFLAKFGLGAGRYLAMVDRWMDAWPEANFEFRRFDPRTFPNGDVVCDIMGVMGLDITQEERAVTQDAANATPSLDTLDLMQLVAQLPNVHPRQVMRSLPLEELPKFSGAVMSNVEAKAIMANFEDENEVLRQRFFPNDSALFDMADLDGPEPEIVKSSFTDEQRKIIGAVLQAVAKQAG